MQVQEVKSRGVAIPGRDASCQNTFHAASVDVSEIPCGLVEFSQTLKKVADVYIKRILQRCDIARGHS